MNIKGGALEFDIIANNGQINSALAETKRRVQGFTDATVEGGDRMEAAYREAAAQIEAAFKDCLLYTSPSPRDGLLSRMPSSA